MAMRPCNKCFENNWSFEKIEDIIRATCKNCQNEVEFPTTKDKAKKGGVKNRKYDLKEGSPCKKCGGPLILRESKKNKSNSAYYFTAYYWCVNCNKLYHSEKFKVWRDKTNRDSRATTSDEENRNGPVVTLDNESGLPESNEPRPIFYSDAGTNNNGNFGNQETIIVATDETGKVVVEEWIGDKTNNEGELTAIMRVASIAPEKSIIFSDSQLSVNLINGHWKARHDRMKALLPEVVSVIKAKKIQVEWVPRDKNLAGIYIESRHSL